VFIDWRQAVKEGRLTQEYIDEMRKKPYFDVFYECLFPEEDFVDEQGYGDLLTEEEVKAALVDSDIHFGTPMMGIDPADIGENESLIVIRYPNLAKVVFADKSTKLIDLVAKSIKAIDFHRVDGSNVSVDRIGVGALLPDALAKERRYVYGVNVAEKASNEEQFANLRAELAWRVREWIKSGGKLLKDKRWSQVSQIKFKEDHRGRFQIMPKDEMRRRGIRSPDAFDALALTFVRPTVPILTKEERFEQARIQKEVFNPYEII
jgi:hypothetical protein